MKLTTKPNASQRNKANLVAHDGLPGRNLTALKTTAAELGELLIDVRLQRCRVCGKPSKPLRRGRCNACNVYFRAHGIDRQGSACVED